MNRALLALALAASCVKGGAAPLDPAGSPLQVLEAARARPMPDPIRARLHLKLVSEPLELSSGTGAVLIVDRPGRAHLAVMGPLGGPLLTLTSDGQALAVALPRERRLLASPQASAVLAEVTGGMVELDDLVGLLLGDIPFDEARVRRRQLLPDGRVQVVLDGPDGVRLDLVLDPERATPVQAVVADRSGRVLLVADFDPFTLREDGLWVPTRAALQVPSLGLELELRYRSWEVLDEVPPVFGTGAPDPAWTTEPLEAALPPLNLSRDAHP